MLYASIFGSEEALTAALARSCALVCCFSGMCLYRLYQFRAALTAHCFQYSDTYNAYSAFSNGDNTRLHQQCSLHSRLHIIQPTQCSYVSGGRYLSTSGHRRGIAQVIQTLVERFAGHFNTDACLLDRDATSVLPIDTFSDNGDNGCEYTNACIVYRGSASCPCARISRLRHTTAHSQYWLYSLVWCQSRSRSPQDEQRNGLQVTGRHSNPMW